jgi:hypothetical protein
MPVMDGIAATGRLTRLGAPARADLDCTWPRTASCMWRWRPRWGSYSRHAAVRACVRDQDWRCRWVRALLGITEYALGSLGGFMQLAGQGFGRLLGPQSSTRRNVGSLPDLF